MQQDRPGKGLHAHGVPVVTQPEAVCVQNSGPHRVQEHYGPPVPQGVHADPSISRAGQHSEHASFPSSHVGVKSMHDHTTEQMPASGGAGNDKMSSMKQINEFRNFHVMAAIKDQSPELRRVEARETDGRIQMGSLGLTEMGQHLRAEQNDKQQNWPAAYNTAGGQVFPAGNMPQLQSSHAGGVAQVPSQERLQNAFNPGLQNLVHSASPLLQHTQFSSAVKRPHLQSSAPAPRTSRAPILPSGIRPALSMPRSPAVHVAQSMLPAQHVHLHGANRNAAGVLGQAIYSGSTPQQMLPSLPYAQSHYANFARMPGRFQMDQRMFQSPAMPNNYAISPVMYLPRGGIAMGQIPAPISYPIPQAVRQPASMTKRPPAAIRSDGVPVHPFTATGHPATHLHIANASLPSSTTLKPIPPRPVRTSVAHQEVPQKRDGDGAAPMDRVVYTSERAPAPSSAMLAQKPVLTQNPPGIGCAGPMGPIHGAGMIGQEVARGPNKVQQQPMMHPVSVAIGKATGHVIASQNRQMSRPIMLSNQGVQAMAADTTLARPKEGYIPSVSPSVPGVVPREQVRQPEPHVSGDPLGVSRQLDSHPSRRVEENVQRLSNQPVMSCGENQSSLKKPATQLALDKEHPSKQHTQDVVVSPTHIIIDGSPRADVSASKMGPDEGSVGVLNGRVISHPNLRESRQCDETHKNVRSGSPIVAGEVKASANALEDRMDHSPRSGKMPIDGGADILPAEKSKDLNSQNFLSGIGREEKFRSTGAGVQTRHEHGQGMGESGGAGRSERVEDVEIVDVSARGEMQALPISSESAANRESSPLHPLIDSRMCIMGLPSRSKKKCSKLLALDLNADGTMLCAVDPIVGSTLICCLEDGDVQWCHEKSLAGIGPVTTVPVLPDDAEADASGSHPPVPCGSEHSSRVSPMMNEIPQVDTTAKAAPEEVPSDRKEADLPVVGDMKKDGVVEMDPMDTSPADTQVVDLMEDVVMDENNLTAREGVDAEDADHHPRKRAKLMDGRSSVSEKSSQGADDNHADASASDLPASRNKDLDSSRSLSFPTANTEVAYDGALYPKHDEANAREPGTGPESIASGLPYPVEQLLNSARQNRTSQESLLEGLVDVPVKEAETSEVIPDKTRPCPLQIHDFDTTIVCSLRASKRQELDTVFMSTPELQGTGSTVCAVVGFDYEDSATLCWTGVDRGPRRSEDVPCHQLGSSRLVSVPIVHDLKTR